MSISRVYTIIGDANIRRNMTSLNIASRDIMKKAEVIDCLQLSNLDTALSQVRVESSILIVAAITEFLLSGGDCGSIASSIDHILTSFFAKVTGFCATRPAVQVIRVIVKSILWSELWVLGSEPIQNVSVCLARCQASCWHIF